VREAGTRETRTREAGKRETKAGKTGAGETCKTGERASRIKG
jgi:hypothetical protein